ncbi:MAG TPA: SGNH/GDSL hydrolase family protein [Rubrivivax sp.]|nr:SGNH/GDSL hydrolase family protein [Rubrivivax sp.]
MISSSLERFLRAAAVAAAAVAALPAQAAYSSIVFFGDSLSDTGNIWYATGGPNGGLPPAPYYQGTQGAAPDRTGGQWSDYLGPSWPTVFAAKFGLLATPSIAGGNNYAWGGARTGVNPTAGDAPWLDQQVGQYLFGNQANNTTLYSVMIGGNDVANNLASPNTVAGINSIIGSLTGLYNAGGRQFLVANVPDIGATPEFQGRDAAMPGIAALASALTLQWNLALETALDSLALPGASIGFLDLYALGKDPVLLAGYANTTDACLTSASLCPDPSQYFYWDSFHPTSRTHAVIADFAARAVPEPQTALLIAAGLMALAWSRRRHAA